MLNQVLLVRMRSISKAFGPTVAVDGVDLDLLPGDIHGLVGENGAGKSTLMRVLSGFYADYAGEIVVDGRAVRILSPGQARALGIGLVHQELSLVPELTVADNIFLGREPPARLPGFIDLAASS
ncbi:MAG TPA: ATP-binding cassette domain-containing protein, partial [bacterium]|nr:ATP-binding cassette domain-containing protein [bacterium]